MIVGITSVQRNRNPWIVEWLAFHLLVGFNKFYIYVHNTDDGMDHTLVKLSRVYPIEVFHIKMDVPQLQAFRDSYARFGGEVDWMAFIDGDEFLFSPQKMNTDEINQWDIADTLAEYQDKELSALGAYWMHYGSNGHMEEPSGLIVENYPRHALPNIRINRVIKSIVRGGENIQIGDQPHGFNTSRGTFDENLRMIDWVGLKDEHIANGILPTRNKLRVNHYATQSWEYFKNTKQTIGFADLSPLGVRPDSWFVERDRNECDDGLMHNFLVPLKRKVRELQAVVDAGW